MRSCALDTGDSCYSSQSWLCGFLQVLWTTDFNGFPASNLRMLKKARLLTRPTPARRDAPFRAQGRRHTSSDSFPPLLRGVAKAALYCAHRTSTFLSCAFCEQEGHLAAPRSLSQRPVNAWSLPLHMVPGG